MHTKAQIQTGKREEQTFVAQQKTSDHHGKWRASIHTTEKQQQAKLAAIKVAWVGSSELAFVSAARAKSSWLDSKRANPSCEWARA